MNRWNFGFLLLILVVMVIGFTGCRTEIARAPIQLVGDYVISFKHGGGPVELWTDLDIEYIDQTNVWYEMRFYHNGDLIQEITCDPFDHQFQLMARQTEIRGVTKESYLAPMNCSVDLTEGDITVDISLFAEGGRVRIFRADLVINQGE